MLSLQSTRKPANKSKFSSAELPLDGADASLFGIEDACKVAWALVLRLHATSDEIGFAFQGQEQPSILRFSADVAWASKPLDVLNRLHQGQISNGVHGTSKRDSFNTLLECYPHSNKGTNLDAQDLSIAFALRIFSNNGSLRAGLHIRNGELQGEQALNLLRTFSRALNVVRQERDVPLDQVSWCSTHDSRQLERWTARVSQLLPMRLNELVERQARLTPDAIAMVFEDVKLTYAELDRWASGLAAMLVQKYSVTPLSRVMLLFNRGFRPFVAMLAVFKAGCSFAACDPCYGHHRVEDTRLRCGASVILTEEEFVGEWTNAFTTTILVEDRPSAYDSYDLRLLPRTSPDDPCFILFTSGSTHTSKAVLHQHSRFATALLDFARVMDINESTRTLCAEPFSFDICYVEFLATLSRGGQCCVASSRAPNDIDELYRTPMKDYGTTFLLTTPSVLAELNPADYPELETVCSLGEPLPTSILKEWAPHVRLNNQYGMSECGVWVAYHLALDVDCNTSVIGKPGSGAIWLVNPSNPSKLMPVGAVGEIIIEGPNMAIGYLGEDSERAATFLATPPWFRDVHRDRRPERFYRSNDLGRYCPDGTIEYLGRKDNVQKLYGIALDIDEIEQTIKKCINPGDRVSVSVIEDPEAEEEKLVLTAFLCLENSAQPQANHVNGVQASAGSQEDRAPTGRVVVNSSEVTTKQKGLVNGDINGPVLGKLKRIREINGTKKGVDTYVRDKEQTDFSRLSEKIRTHLKEIFPSYMVPSKYCSITEIPMTPSGKTNRKRLVEQALLLDSVLFAVEEW